MTDKGHTFYNVNYSCIYFMFQRSGGDFVIFLTALNSAAMRVMYMQKYSHSRIRHSAVRFPYSSYGRLALFMYQE